MNRPTVRPIERDDLSAVVEILVHGSLHPETEDGDHPQRYWDAVAAARAQGGEILVAEMDNEVVGVLQVIIFAHLIHAGGWCCELEGVHVRADRRSRGIGAAMLAEAERIARERGCYRIQLTSNARRVDAHRFYEAQGYEATHRGFKKSLSPN
jgi:GNAT superfamily N-acetyltransferase